MVARRSATASAAASSSLFTVSPLAVAVEISVPSVVACSRIESLNRVPTLVSRPLTTRSAPSSRPVSTSHSPVQSSSFLPEAARSCTTFSRVITRAAGKSRTISPRTSSLK